MNKQRKVTKPTARLIGEDSNVFGIIGTVAKTLKKAGQKEQAEEFTSRAFDCHSYDAVLALLQEYVEVE